jgi:hypothetical protein
MSHALFHAVVRSTQNCFVAESLLERKTSKPTIVSNCVPPLVAPSEKHVVSRTMDAQFEIGILTKTKLPH